MALRGKPLARVVPSQDVGHEERLGGLEGSMRMRTDLIELAMPLHEWVEQALTPLDARTVPVSHEIAMDAYALDRLLIGAARCRQLTLATADRRILASGGVRHRNARS